MAQTFKIKLQGCILTQDQLDVVTPLLGEYLGDSYAEFEGACIKALEEAGIPIFGKVISEKEIKDNETE
jgi:hypothetical protein